MKKILALGFATVMAASAFALAPTEASARSGPYWYGGGPVYGYNYGNPWHRYPRNGAFFSFRGNGFNFSLGVPVRPHAYGYRYASNPHVAWCQNHYRTYNPATNTYFRRVGVPAACVSPYSY